MDPAVAMSHRSAHAILLPDMRPSKDQSRMSESRRARRHAADGFKVSRELKTRPWRRVSLQMANPSTSNRKISVPVWLDVPKSFLRFVCSASPSPSPFDSFLS